MTELCVIFVKPPRPGLVKTRVAATAGLERATAIYAELVSRLLRELAPLTAVQLRYAPDDALGEIQPWLLSAWKACPQSAGDLGERLNNAFEEAFAEGMTRVVIIGSDCPELARRDIVEAWSALAEGDLVLGPAADGGYWLVGLRKPVPALFQGIPWSTGKVLADTLAVARHLGLKTRLLRQLRDVDTEADWVAFQERERPFNNES